ncbi:hypothetical protein DFH28DRAFT_891681 [Melampsora americana]|nr:hypothetical protein DFH28DRAFT_891681 [Melampsora americana]
MVWSVLTWTVFHSICMVIPMDTTSGRILGKNSRLSKFPPNRQILIDHNNINNIYRESTSTDLDPNAHLTFKRQKLTHQGGAIQSHDQQKGDLSLESQGGSSKNGIWMARKPPRPNKLPHSATSSRSPTDNHKDTAVCLITSHPSQGFLRQKEQRQKEHDSNPRMKFDLNQLPGSSEIQTIYAKAIGSSKNISLKRIINNPSGKSTKDVTISPSPIKKDPQPRASEIDIKTFHQHTPDKMCSAAAIYYTRDLIMNLSDRYSYQAQLTQCPSWELGKQIWTSERLLPFVYFVVACNPSRKIWRHIKLFTTLVLRTYHKLSVKNKTISDEEKLTQFLLWHTEVMYHTTLLAPMIKASSTAEMKGARLSTLSRVFLLINDYDGFDQTCKTANCQYMLWKHVSKTFEIDSKSGYPITKPNQIIDGATLKNWNTKSNEIRNIGKKVDWSRFENVGWDESHPLLLMEQDIETLKKDSKLSVSMKYWEEDLKNMLVFIRPTPSTNLALPEFSLVEICKGIHKFMKKNMENEEKRSDMRRIPEYQVTLYSHFLHQKSDDKSFKKFW